MTQLPQQPVRLSALSGELALGIAQDLENVTDRIAEMKALCDQQMGELADAAAAAAGIAGGLARRQAPVAADPAFLSLKSELAHLSDTVAAQIEVYRNISRQFLEIARRVGAEIMALRAAGASPANAVDPASARNVVWLSARRETLDDAATQAGANELRQALHGMQESAVTLFRAQVESGKMVASLRQRMRDYRQRTRDA